MGFLLPARCGGCDRTGWVVCPSCAAALRPAPAAGLVPAGLDSCRSLLAYVGPAGALVRAVKYANNRGAVRWLADGLAAVAPAVDLLSWAPTSAARRRRRGYDQAELLARALARRIDVPLRPTLRRRPGPAQTDLDRAGRLAHPGFDPVGAPAAGRRVLVVDDVITTGATLAAAAGALRAAGATEIHGLTAAAAAPPRAPPGPSPDYQRTRRATLRSPPGHGRRRLRRRRRATGRAHASGHPGHARSPATAHAPGHAPGHASGPPDTGIAGDGARVGPRAGPRLRSPVRRRRRTTRRARWGNAPSRRTSPGSRSRSERCR